MELLLKKLRGNSKNTITLQEIKKELELAGLKKDQNNNKKVIQELQKRPKIDKKHLLELLLGEFLASNKPINLTNAPSIEKNDKIAIGTVYYNTKTDSLRLKKKIGWVTINTE